MSHSTISNSSGLLSPPPTPPEESKPPIPYIKGASFIVQQHEPPAPFGGSYSSPTEPDTDALERATQLDWCLSHPPSPGILHSENTRRIIFMKAIRTGDGKAAQILLTEEGLVAKIYDPLYYRFVHKDSWEPWTKYDVATRADSDYSIEVAAYEELRGTEIEGNITPTYHGSWTLDIPVTRDEEEITRQVRMILLEHIDGCCMRDIDAYSLSREARNNVIVKVMEAACDILYAGVSHCDVFLRNVIIVGADLEALDLRICLFDFNVSVVHRFVPGKPRNPKYFSSIVSFVGQTARFSYDGWLPEGQEGYEWIWMKWKDSEKYGRVERDPTDPVGRALIEISS